MDIEIRVKEAVAKEIQNRDDCAAVLLGGTEILMNSTARHAAALEKGNILSQKDVDKKCPNTSETGYTLSTKKKSTKKKQAKCLCYVKNNKLKYKVAQKPETLQRVCEVQWKFEDANSGNAMGMVEVKY